MDQPFESGPEDIRPAVWNRLTDALAKTEQATLESTGLAVPGSIEEPEITTLTTLYGGDITAGQKRKGIGICWVWTGAHWSSLTGPLEAGAGSSVSPAFATESGDTPTVIETVRAPLDTESLSIALAGLLDSEQLAERLGVLSRVLGQIPADTSRISRNTISLQITGIDRAVMLAVTGHFGVAGSAGGEVGLDHFQTRDRALADQVFYTLRSVYQRAIGLLRAKLQADAVQKAQDHRAAIEHQNEVDLAMEGIDRAFWQAHITRAFGDGVIDCRDEIQAEALCQYMQRWQLPVERSGHSVLLSHLLIGGPENRSFIDRLTQVLRKPLVEVYEQAVEPELHATERLREQLYRAIEQAVLSALAQKRAGEPVRSRASLQVSLDGVHTERELLQKWLSLHFDRQAAMRNNQITFRSEEYLRGKFYFLFGRAWPELSQITVGHSADRIQAEDPEPRSRTGLLLERSESGPEYPPVVQSIMKRVRAADHLRATAFSLETDEGRLLRQLMQTHVELPPGFEVTGTGRPACYLRVPLENNLSAQQAFAELLMNIVARSVQSVQSVQIELASEVRESRPVYPAVVQEIMDQIRQARDYDQLIFSLDSEAGKILKVLMEQGWPYNTNFMPSYNAQEGVQLFYLVMPWNNSQGKDKWLVKAHRVLADALARVYAQMHPTGSIESTELPPTVGALVQAVEQALKGGNGQATFRLQSPEGQCIYERMAVFGDWDEYSVDVLNADIRLTRRGGPSEDWDHIDPVYLEGLEDVLNFVELPLEEGDEALIRAFLREIRARGGRMTIVHDDHTEFLLHDPLHSPKFGGRQEWVWETFDSDLDDPEHASYYIVHFQGNGSVDDAIARVEAQLEARLSIKRSEVVQPAAVPIEIQPEPTDVLPADAKAAISAFEELPALQAIEYPRSRLADMLASLKGLDGQIGLGIQVLLQPDGGVTVMRTFTGIQVEIIERRLLEWVREHPL